MRPEDGPFEYVPGSHRTDRRRLRWEYQHSVFADSLDTEGQRGSFRVTEEDLPALGLPGPRSFPVEANTLVIADVRGFHWRGAGTLGAQRLSLYANYRPHPFSPTL